MAALHRRHLVLASAAACVAGASGPAFAQQTRGGFSRERLARIPATLQRYVDAGTVGGFVTLIERHGDIAQINALGWRDREANAPMQRDCIFRIASMTKPMTCVAALTLMEQGRIGLNDPIDRWLPEFANPRVMNDPAGALANTHAAPRAITLLDLLTHRSGVAGLSATGALAQATRGLHDDNPTMDEWLRRLSAVPLAYDPGAHFNYGTSHDILGALIQRISGQPYRDYLKAAVLDPLGMRDTSFWLAPEKQNRLVQVYGRETQEAALRATPQPVFTTPQNFDYGGGGLLSTAGDLQKFARMLLNHGRLGNVRILTRPTVALMTTNWLTPQQRAEGFYGQPNFWNSMGYGLGVSVTDDVTRLGNNPYTSPGSFGWAGNSGILWRGDPVEDMVTIFLLQSSSPTTTAGPGDLSTPPLLAFYRDAYAAVES